VRLFILKLAAQEGFRVSGCGFPSRRHVKASVLLCPVEQMAKLDYAVLGELGCGLLCLFVALFFF
jgi:hypothetical protein